MRKKKCQVGKKQAREEMPLVWTKLETLHATIKGKRKKIKQDLSSNLEVREEQKEKPLCL